MTHDQCKPYRAWALKQIKELKPELVILSGLLDTPLLDPNAGKAVSDSEGRTLFIDFTSL